MGVPELLQPALFALKWCRQKLEFIAWIQRTCYIGVD